MSDRWGTYAFEFKGGLISNLSPLQHGIQAPGSARILTNFEPSTEGGYRRINGFDKYSTSQVPKYGVPLVQGSGQSGTTLVIANLFTAPVAGDTLTIAGVTGTYTIAVGGVSYSSTNKVATLTLVETLDSSPADKAIVTFVSNSGMLCGIAAWEDAVIACRNSLVYSGIGSGWTQINVPSYGTVEVDGATQTGTTLNVKGLTEVPQVGDTFTIAGVEKVYTVTALPTVTAGDSALTINPTLASSPADEATITFITAARAVSKNRYAKYRIANVEKIVGVNSSDWPFIWDGTTFKVLTKAPADVQGAEHACFFKNQLFFSKGDALVFTAPYTDTDFNTANGSGVISVGSKITGLIVFRDQLIIFCENKIERLTGNTLSDFVKQPITEKIGCVDRDTIQEVAGDIMFLGPDGLRLLTGTDVFGDFDIGVVSKPIQKEVTQLISNNTSFSSVVIKKKSQYRLFGYSSATSTDASNGILGAQVSGEQGLFFAWAQTRGIKAFTADSNYNDKEETVIFSNDDGYVYKLESGNSFDGANINATFATPFVPITDPRIRKTFYKLFLYTDPEGSINILANLRLDFNNTEIIQPDSILLSNTSGLVNLYGTPTAKYGTVTYGGVLKTLFETQTIGSGFVVSLRFTSNGTTAPFALDAATLEYAEHDRR
jgi:hypothetical protein